LVQSFKKLFTLAIAARLCTYGSLTGFTHKSSPITGELHGVFRSGILASRRGQGRVQTWSVPRRLRGHAGFWLQALSQPSIDLTLRTHASLLTRIVESPGRSLSPEGLERLVSQPRIVAGKTLPQQSLTYGIFSGDPEPMSRAIVTLICEESTGRPIAFNALSVMEVELDGAPVEVTHLGLVMVDPDVRGQGLSMQDSTKLAS
jgi:hypothetical protein